MTLNIALRVALGSGFWNNKTYLLTNLLIFTKFDIRQLIRAWIIAFFADTLCHAVTLTIDPLTLKIHGTSSVKWSKSVYTNLSEIEQSKLELLIILRISAHVMSRRDLDLWPWTFTALRLSTCHAFKLRTKFERNRIIQRGARLTNGGYVEPTRPNLART